MSGINEILIKLTKGEKLTKEEKFKILHSKRIKPEVVNYLKTRLKNLYIEVLANHEGTLFELMHSEKLESWSWQTTESAIVFLNDDDYIERGYLYFDENNQYFHSWICFNYNGTKYVLDPSLNFLCKKEDYAKIFKTDVKAKVSAKAVKEELIKLVTTPKQEVNPEIQIIFEHSMSSILGKCFEKHKKEKADEVIAKAPEDVNTPLYRNGAGYQTKLTKGKIRKLKVHYYYTDC